jgi:hypothetical protein
MTTVTEHTSSPSHHPSSVLATQKGAKMRARSAELSTLYECPGIHFHELKLIKFEKKYIS